MKKNKNSGFSLIELLVVISIIGILSSVVMNGLSSSRQKSRDAKRVADIKQLQLNLELYYDVNRKYPGTLSGLVPSFVSTVPVPPGGTGATSYFYVPLSANGGACNDYHLGASLERESDPVLLDDFDASGGTVATAGSCGTTVSGSEFRGDSTLCLNFASSPERCYDVKS